MNGLPPKSAIEQLQGPFPELCIRMASAGDVPRLAQLSQDAPLAAQWTVQQYRNIFELTSPRRCAMVMEGSSTLQGFIVGRCLPEEWEIENIVVAASHRRQGLGARLMREFIHQAQAEKARSIWLEVRESNRAAQALYRKLGFRESGRRKMYYATPDEDALIYQLRFAD